MVVRSDTLHTGDYIMCYISAWMLVGGLVGVWWVVGCGGWDSGQVGG